MSLNEMLNFPFILLDECLSSLDSGMADQIIRHIGENNKDKMIILIAHQMEEGAFDNIISLE